MATLAGFSPPLRLTRNVLQLQSCFFEASFPLPLQTTLHRLRPPWRLTWTEAPAGSLCSDHLGLSQWAALEETRAPGGWMALSPSLRPSRSLAPQPPAPANGSSVLPMPGLVSNMLLLK